MNVNFRTGLRVVGSYLRRRFGLVMVAALFASGLMHPLRAADERVSPVRLASGELQLLPSFEACSFYFRPPERARAPFTVEFRGAGAARWLQAFEPVTDRPAGIWKGSLFQLTEDSAFEARVVDAGGIEIIAPVTFRTWSAHPPIARTIDLSTLASPPRGLVISDQGSPSGWIRYTAPKGWQLERASGVADAELAAITFRNARYVILENVTVAGGARHGVLVETSEDVRILNCDISGWGRVGVQHFTNTGTRGKYVDASGVTINYDAGVAIDRSARTVVERCYIHDPRGRANSWMFSHPTGPTAVHANSTRGGSVLRWNDFIGSDEHRWNDVIEASSNSAPDGGFFRDSDIAGNYLAFGNDDGVELEGGGMNIRFYRNRIEGTLCGVSTGASILGPQFVYGNLVANPGDESGLALMHFKNSHGSPQTGKRHFFNNTLFGSRASAYGSYGNASAAGDDRLGYMRNNVFVASGARLPGAWGKRENFDHDLFWHERDPAIAHAYLTAWQALGQEAHGVVADPRFVAPSEGDFRLRADSQGRQRGEAVANITPAGSDLGAFFAGGDLPERPLALSAAPQQLEFGRATRRGAKQVTLSMPANAPAAVPFEIRQNRAFTWFRVSPQSGLVAPGKTVTLTIEVADAALHGRPRFRGAFLVRTPGGLSRPISVYANTDFAEEQRPAEAPNSMYIASNQTTRATVSLPRAGRYALLLRAGISQDPEARREVSVTVDAAQPQRVAVPASYYWSTGETRVRTIFLQDLGELGAGAHELRLERTAGDLDVHEFIVTDNPTVFFIDHWHREKDRP